MPQMTKVNSQYGAPMGRYSYGLIQNCEPRTIRLFRVSLNNGGYDDGGAYWGFGEPIYCATDDADFFQTVRASNRVHACLLLDIEPQQLKKPLTGLRWLRWEAIRACIGESSQAWEISEFGKPLGYVEDWLGLCHFAQTCVYTQGSGLKIGEGIKLYKSVFTLTK